MARRGWKVAGLAGAIAAMLGTVGVLGSPPAQASVLGTSVTAASAPPVYVGMTAQPAGDLVLSVPDSFAQGDTLVLAVAPPVPSGSAPGSGGNCSSATDTVGYHTVPQATVTAPSGETPAQITPSLTHSSACSTTTVDDELVLTFDNNGSGGQANQTVTVTGIAYDLGTGVPTGSITVTLTTPPLPTPEGQVSNATAYDVVFGADNPPTAVEPGPFRPIPDFTLAETVGGAIPAGTTVCFEITEPSSGVSFVTSQSPPTVSATNGAVVTSPASSPETGPPGAQTVDGQVLTFEVTTASSATPATFTVSGIHLATPSTPVGLVKVHAGIWNSTSQSCGSEYGGPLVATSVSTLRQLYGQDRYQTAATIFESRFQCTPSGTSVTTSAVLATGENFPDALAANYLAGYLKTGILLTETDSLPSSTLQALATSGVHTVYIVGGTAAVSSAVQQQLESTAATDCTKSPFGGGYTTTTSMLQVQRIASTSPTSTRYDTAELIAEEPGAANVGTLNASGNPAATPEPTAIIATGLDFPDALAAGPMAYKGTNGSNGNGKGFPLLLTDPNSLSPQAATALSSLGIKQVLIAGGPAAVSMTVQQQIEAMHITVVERFAGADRTATAADIAAFETAGDNGSGPTAGPVGLFYNTSGLSLARGDVFADALSGGPHAATATGGPEPILLTLPTNLDAAGPYIQASALSYDTDQLTVFGGPAAVAPATVEEAFNDLTGS